MNCLFINKCTKHTKEVSLLQNVWWVLLQQKRIKKCKLWKKYQYNYVLNLTEILLVRKQTYPLSTYWKLSQYTKSLKKQNSPMSLWQIYEYYASVQSFSKIKDFYNNNKSKKLYLNTLGQCSGVNVTHTD